MDKAGCNRGQQRTLGSGPAHLLRVGLVLVLPKGLPHGLAQRLSAGTRLHNNKAHSLITRRRRRRHTLHSPLAHHNTTLPCQLAFTDLGGADVIDQAQAIAVELRQGQR